VCNLHRSSFAVPTIMLDGCCQLCFQITHAPKRRFCASCEGKLREPNVTRNKLEAACMRAILTLQTTSPDVVADVRSNVTLSMLQPGTQNKRSVAELDCVFSATTTEGKLTVVLEADGTDHINMIAGKDAVAALMAAKMYTVDEAGALVIVRMRSCPGENTGNLEDRQRSILHTRCGAVQPDVLACQLSACTSVSAALSCFLCQFCLHVTLLQREAQQRPVLSPSM
jgi:hypothetical protein